MKKILLAMAVILAFATMSYADVSFLTAPSVGEGNWAVLGMYATNHNGAVANTDNVQAMDSTNLGVRGEYGIMQGLDVLAAYSMTNLPDVKEIDSPNDSGKQTSGSTMGLGLKYSLGKMMDVDTAVAGGYQQSSVGVKADGLSSATISSTSLSIAYVVSKQVDNLMPYGAVAYKMLSRDLGKTVTGSTVDSNGGTGLALNIGCMIGIAKNQAIAVEYNTENQAWDEITRHGKAANPKDKDSSAINVSGISLGYVCMF